MRKSYYSRFATLIFIVNISISCHPLSAQLIPEAPDLKNYYSLLKNISPLPPQQQRNELKKHLIKFGAVEQAYFKLVELSLLENELDSLSAYFHDLASQARYRRNSLWALAKLYNHRRKHKKAFAAYTEAIKTGPITPPLLKDFLEFSIIREKVFNWKDVLRIGNFDSTSTAILSAFAAHFKSQHSLAARLFAGLPETLSHHPQILHLWGHCFYEQAFYEQADSLWELGLKRARETGDLQAEAQFLTSLGVTASQVFLDNDSATKYYSQAEQIAMRIGDCYRLQMVLGNRAMAKKKYSETIADYQEAIRIAEQIRSYDDAASWYMGLAQAYFSTERFTEALDANNAGEKLARSGADKTVLLQIIRDKGDFLFDLHQDSLARVTYQEVYDLAKAEKRVRQEKSVNARLADYLLHEKKYADARTAYFDFIDFLPDDADYDLKAYWLGRIAESYKLEGRFDLARIEYNRAIQIAIDGDNELYENWLRLETAKLDLFDGKIQQAIGKCNEIIDYATEWQDDQLRWQTYYVLGTAFKARGDLKDAIALLKKATALIEKTRHKLSLDQLRISYFSEAHEAYRQLVSCYLSKFEKTNAPADLDTLFYFTQLTRGRTLHELGLRKQAAQQSWSQDQEYRQHVTRLRRIQRQLRFNPGKPIQRQSELEAARLALITKRLRLAGGETHSEDKTLMAEAQWLSPVVQHLKKQNTCLLLYHIARDTSFVFVVAGDAAQIVGVDTEPDSLRTMIDYLITPFHAVKKDSVQYVKFHADLAYQLYRTLIRGVEKAFKGNLPENLLIIPDIALVNLPFDVLLVNEQKTAAYTPNGRPEYAQDFLLHRYTISYSPSLSFLGEGSQFFNMPPDILIFANPFTKAAVKNANPRQGVWQVDALPYAEDEARKIEALYGNRAQVFMHAEATKALFLDLAGDYGIIHFATHAFADKSFDAFSRLFLAASEDSTDDGLLMGYEIADLRLQADLVTLSACETGRGRIVSGEGVLGLPRLFLGAGAKSVLMTQWVIDDEFASQLLPEFYRFCLNRKLSKAQALAEAKRQLLRDIKPVDGRYYQHPFYWAAYSLYGNPGRIQYMNGWTLIFYSAVVLLFCALAIFASYRCWYRRKNT